MAKHILVIGVWAILVSVVGGVSWVAYNETRKHDAVAKFADYGVVPDFTLIEAGGKNVKLADLKGSVWVASFIFTRCAGACPIMSHRMSGLQKRFPRRGGWRFVSISVDPDFDSPDVLAAYAKQYNADPRRWWFLTGDKKRIRDLSQNGFHLSAENSEDPGAIIHSQKFVLVDQRGHIRGYYDGTDVSELQRLVNDANLLMSIAL